MVEALVSRDGLAASPRRRLQEVAEVVVGFYQVQGRSGDSAVVQSA